MSNKQFPRDTGHRTRGLRSSGKQINYFHLLYLEIAVLSVIAGLRGLSIVILESTPAATCRETAWTLVPYIYYHFDEVCGRPRLSAILAAYYGFTLLIAGIAQFFYLRGRRKLAIVSPSKFGIVLFMIVFVLFAWLTGRESGSFLFDFSVHEAGAVGPYMVAVGLPSFQFILSVLMVGERETVES